MSNQVPIPHGIDAGLVDAKCVQTAPDPVPQNQVTNVIHWFWCRMMEKWKNTYMLVDV